MNSFRRKLVKSFFMEFRRQCFRSIIVPHVDLGALLQIAE